MLGDLRHKLLGLKAVKNTESYVTQNQKIMIVCVCNNKCLMLRSHLIQDSSKAILRMHNSI